MACVDPSAAAVAARLPYLFFHVVEPLPSSPITDSDTGIPPEDD